MGPPRTLGSYPRRYMVKLEVQPKTAPSPRRTSTFGRLPPIAAIDTSTQTADFPNPLIVWEKQPTAIACILCLIFAPLTRVILERFLVSPTKFGPHVAHQVTGTSQKVQVQLAETCCARLSFLPWCVSLDCFSPQNSTFHPDRVLKMKCA